MGLQIQQPPMPHLLRILGILLVVYFGIHICSCSVTENTFNKVDNTRMSKSHAQTRTMSAIACCSECYIYSWCRSLSYKPSSNDCQLSGCKDVGQSSESNSEWVTFVKGLVGGGTNYLVSGLNGVQDSQLTQSSYWCEYRSGCIPTDAMAARYSRLNLTGINTGAWGPSEARTNQYVQVEFHRVETISAIALQGRSTIQNLRTPYIQYVTRFRVLTSLDCVSFSYIADDSDNDKIFVGNSSPEEIVTRYFQELVLAKCVRINPVQWVTFPSLRFDVLGC